MPAQISNETYTVSNPVGTSRTNFPVNTLQGATSVYSVTFLTLAGGAIANTQLTSISLSLFDVNSVSVINSRQDQDVLGAGKTGQNNVTVSATSDIVWTLQTADNVIVDVTNTVKVEQHLARFTVVYDVGSGPDVDS